MAVPVGQAVVALVAGNTQVAVGTVVGKGKVLTKLSDLQKERRPVMLVDSSGRVYDAKVEYLESFLSYTTYTTLATLAKTLE